MANLYGWSPRIVEELEVWEIAELLGVNDAEAQRRSGLVTPAEHKRQAADLIRRRIEAAAKGEKVAVDPLPGPHGMIVTAEMRAALVAQRAERSGKMGQ